MMPGAAKQPEAVQLIPPHGGVLVDRLVANPVETGALPALELDDRSFADVECIATGVYSPLSGFLEEREYASVIETMRLPNGVPWTVPVTLPCEPTFAARLHDGARVALARRGQVIASLTISSIFAPDRSREALAVYRTADSAHPGVAALYSSAEVCLGGTIDLLVPIAHASFGDYRFTPRQTRAIFCERGWRTVAAFQTRNPMHRAHEYLQKTALENVDGLFLNPLVGATKCDDVPADVRMRTYEAILRGYFPASRVVLGVFPAAMRYAGPREAVLHAIARKNYGCTHFIVGRDHAGVGSYYGPYDAQRIFDEFAPGELGIVPLKYESAQYCRRCGQFGTRKTCPHGEDDWLQLSGTVVRAKLAAGEMPPPELTRPEVARILMDAYRKGNQQ